MYNTSQNIDFFTKKPILTQYVGNVLYLSQMHVCRGGGVSSMTGEEEGAGVLHTHENLKLMNLAAGKKSQINEFDGEKILK